MKDETYSILQWIIGTILEASPLHSLGYEIFYKDKSKQDSHRSSVTWLNTSIHPYCVIRVPGLENHGTKRKFKTVTWFVGDFSSKVDNSKMMRYVLG